MLMSENCPNCISTVECASSGVARILCWGGPENRGAEFESGEGNGERVSPSPANYGVWGSVVSSPSGVRADPRPKTDFGAFWPWKNESGDDKFDIFVIFIAHILSQIYKASFDIFFSFAGGLGPSGPPLATPMCASEKFYESVSIWQKYCQEYNFFSLLQFYFVHSQHFMIGFACIVSVLCCQSWVKRFTTAVRKMMFMNYQLLFVWQTFVASAEVHTLWLFSRYWY